MPYKLRHKPETKDRQYNRIKGQKYITDEPQETSDMIRYFLPPTHFLPFQKLVFGYRFDKLAIAIHCVIPMSRDVRREKMKNLRKY